MARLREIRITKNDRQDFSKLAKNIKAKIRRTSKNHGIDISDKIAVPKRITDFKTRKEFNEWKENAKHFTNRYNLELQFKTNAHNVTASVADIQRTQRATKRAKEIAKKLKKEAVEKPFVSGGKVQGTVGQQLLQMGKPNTAGITEPRDFDFNDMKDRKQFDKRMESMEKRASNEYFSNRMETMKNNFIKILGLSFNSDAEELIEKIRSVPADDFYEMYLMFDEFDFDLYDSDNDGGYADSSHIAQMMSYIEIYERGGVDFDLKGF